MSGDLEEVYQFTKNELQQILTAMNAARDAIQPITTAQVKLHGLNPQTDKLLDDAADLIVNRVKGKEHQV